MGKATFEQHSIRPQMTQQDFNHIFYKFTGNKGGIRPTDQLSTTGKELKDFIEFALKQQVPTSSEAV